MSKTKFSQVLDFITAGFDLLVELAPLGSAGIEIIRKIIHAIKDFKEELKEDADNVSAMQD